MCEPTVRTFSYIAATLVAAGAAACAGDDNIGPAGPAIARGGAAELSISDNGGDKMSSGNAGSPGAGGSSVAGSEGTAGSNIEIADASDAASVSVTEAGSAGRDLSTNRDLFRRR